MRNTAIKHAHVRLFGRSPLAQAQLFLTLTQAHTHTDRTEPCNRIAEKIEWPMRRQMRANGLHSALCQHWRRLLVLIRIENVDRSGAEARKCYTMNAHDAVVKYPFLCEPFDYNSRDFSFTRVFVRLCSLSAQLHARSSASSSSSSPLSFHFVIYYNLTLFSVKRTQMLRCFAYPNQVRMHREPRERESGAHGRRLKCQGLYCVWRAHPYRNEVIGENTMRHISTD